MPYNFRFVRRKNNFVWENNEVRVVFSDPGFQAHDEYGYVKSIKGILYNYYTLSIYKISKHGWKLVATKSTYDFPQIVDLILNLDPILFEDIKNIPHTEQKTDNNEITVYKASYQSEEFYYDDFYNISKTCIETDKDRIVRYGLYIGCSPKVQGSSHTEGVWIDNLSQMEVEEFYTCVKSFMEYAIENHNNAIIEMNRALLKYYKVRGNKLYKEDKGKVEEVYCVGEHYDFVCLKGSLDTKDFSSISYKNCEIEKITEDTIYIAESENRKAFEIKLNTVLELFLFDISDEKLFYNVDEIAEDWVSILNEDEKKEFKDSSLEELHEKWCEAIIDRTWMCRPEHNFPNIVEDKGEHENVYATVTEVIKRVKEIL